jgi:hypothetical protein
MNPILLLWIRLDVGRVGSWGGLGIELFGGAVGGLGAGEGWYY